MNKNVDIKKRWRNITVGFRMSKEESEELNACVKLSGHTKQEYIVNRLMARDVVVEANPRIYKALRNQMVEIHNELQRINELDHFSDELLSIINLTAITLNGLKGE